MDSSDANAPASDTPAWTVDTALDKFPTGRPAEHSESPLPYFHLLERLKTTKRAGWTRFPIDRVESVADHSYRMAMMAMFPPVSLSSKLDISKCIRMALIHDIAESVVGDITPGDGVPKSEKSRREIATVEHIERNILGSVHRDPSSLGLLSLWNEFEEGVSLESQFVQDLDKIEMLHQMVEYEKSTHGRADLMEFRYVVTKIRLPEMKQWADAVVQESREFRQQSGLPEDPVDNQAWKDKQNQYYGGPGAPKPNN